MADLRDRLESWDDLTVVHRDDAISIDGHGFTAIARLELLQLLQRHCAAAGVEMRFETRVERVTLDDYDLVVGSDGVRSRVRDQFAPHFEPASRWLSNKYIWYGTGRVFDALSLIFREFDGGFYVAHAYASAPEPPRFSSNATWAPGTVPASGR